MKRFIQLKSRYFKIVNVNNIKRIEQVKNYTRLRYTFADNSEFVEVFETEEEFQDRLQNVRKFLIDEISPEEYIKIRQKEEQEKIKNEINRVRTDVNIAFMEELLRKMKK